MNPKVTIYYNPSCPYCHMALEFFKMEFPDIVLNKIELNGTPGENRDKFIDGLTECHIESNGIPLIVVGDKCFQGFDPDIALEIKRKISGL